MKKKDFLLNNRGLTLLNAVVAIGILGIASVGFMKFSKNISDSQVRYTSYADKAELRRMIRMIIDDSDHCKISISDTPDYPSPEFRKQDHDDIDDDQEGIDFELYLSDQSGNVRAVKKLSSTGDESKFGNLKIESMKLYMNEATVGAGLNYLPGSVVNDMGLIRVRFSERVSGDMRRDSLIDINMAFEITTSNIGRSKVTNCYTEDLEEIADLSFSANRIVDTASFFTNINCAGNEVVTGVCTSGENRDCPPGSSRAKGIRCTSFGGDISINVANDSHDLRGGFGAIVTCPPFHVITQVCASGENADCSKAGFTRSYTHIKCVAINAGDKKLVREKHRLIPGDSWFSYTYCPAGSYLTGLCTSGRSKDCSGNARILRCSTLNP